MKKLILSILLVGCFATELAAQDSIYNRPISSIEGAPIQLGDFRDKNMLFIELPLVMGDTAVQQQLLRFQQRYDSSKVRVIGLLSIEDGYTIADKTGIQEMYKDNIVAGMLLSAGMYVRKAAGSSQHALAQWLSNKDFNEHYDEDIDGTGKKFFVSGQGVLYAVLGSDVSLDDPIVDKIAEMQ
jgi:glutathione peroxidase-family protein